MIESASAVAHEDVAAEATLVRTDALTASMVETVDVDSPDALGNAEILRTFDGLRRRIAQRVIGNDGAFIGYDAIHLAPWESNSSGKLRYTVRLLAASESTHRVHYEAVFEVESGRGDPAGRRHKHVIAHGVGTTVGTTRALPGQTVESTADLSSCSSEVR